MDKACVGGCNKAEHMHAKLTSAMITSGFRQFRSSKDNYAYYHERTHSREGIIRLILKLERLILRL